MGNMGIRDTPGEYPRVLGAAHSGEEAVLLGAHVSGQVLLPREVPLLLIPGCDGVAVHRRLEVRGDDAEG